MAKLSTFSIDPESGSLIYNGATTEELCEALKLKGTYRKIYLFNKLANFTQYSNLMGLKIKQNPFNQKWYVCFNPDLNKINQTNPFENHPRLGATLYTILALILIHRNEISIDMIKKYRKKQNISTDLEQLENMNYIIRKSNKITIHPNLGYYLDFPQLLKSFENTNFEN
jgi:hypothetical protein